MSVFRSPLRRWAGAKGDDRESKRGRACELKVVMTGSAEDGPEWQNHIDNKKQRRDLASQFKDAKNSFKIVIVRDMWLTGFDAPCWERQKYGRVGHSGAVPSVSGSAASFWVPRESGDRGS